MTNAFVEKLIQEAMRASKAAYCPYSRFSVGAAVLASSGKIYAGCNVENASYGLTICAERNAVFQAVLDGMKAIEAVVIYTPTDEPAAPCGACRQVLNEFGPEAEVLSVCKGTQKLEMRVSELLPHAFGPANLD
jgi:cytidine deaminase